MAITDDLNRITEWMQTHVCNKVKFKLPADERNADGYHYELVTPTAFPLFQPGKDHLPPTVRAPVPSLCVRLQGGEHRPMEGVHELNIEVHFCTWNPGTHGPDVYEPKGTGWEGYNQRTAEEFTRNLDGWQDVYSFIDTALREIENAGYIDGLRVKTENGVKFGMVEAEQLDDNFPYWPAWISFTVQAGNIRNKTIEELL